MNNTGNIKVYVDVRASFAPDGRLTPEQIKWEDGTIYEIDKVLDVRQGFAARAGGQGDRYTIMVRGRQSSLFFERSTERSGRNLGRWFVERRG
ncbi:MAG: hypothetical protein KIG37_05365 [Oscillospiraceae bacterium]|nr:hypothetical protein [Oscillospiraceae bacterium]